MPQGITEDVKKQAGQRINSRFIMYVLGIHKSALKKTQRGRRFGNSAESQQLQRSRDSAKTHNYGTIVERHLEDEQYHMRMHELGYTQSKMEHFDRTALERKNYVANPEKRRCYRDQHSVVQTQSWRRQQRREDQTIP